MRAPTRRALLGCLFLFAATGVLAQDRGSRAEAQAMAEAAAAHVQKAGRPQAFADFQQDRTQWVRKDLYVFAFDFSGTCLAHGVNRKMVGRNLAELLDEQRRSIVLEMATLARTKGSGWISYKWADPLTRRIEPKSAFLVRIDGFDGFVGVGVYETD